MITIGTDCSGIEAPLQALIQMKILYKQLWSCDNDKYTRLSCEANYPRPNTIYTDITMRKNKELPHVDLYVCGFPCQSFSLVGRRLGLDDPRPSVIPAMIDTINKSKPKIIILENVIGFKSIDSGKPYKMLINTLSKDYCIDVSVYNTKDYGLPQNRRRIYFIGIRKDLQKKKFVKPSPVKMKSLESIIDSSIVGPGERKYDYLSEKIKKDGLYHIVGTQFTYNNHFFSGISNTISTTCLPVIFELNREFNIKELLQLQGFSKKFKVVVSKTQMIKQIGNSMSVCVLKKIIKEALNCI